MRWALARECVYSMVSPAFSGRVRANTMGLGRGMVYKMGLPVSSWEGVGKFDGQGEVYKMRCSNLCVLGPFVPLWLAPAVI